MKKFLTDGKEIRRRIISAGWESVADWSRKNGLSVAMVCNQINGKNPVSKTFLAVLQKTQIEHTVKEVPSGAKIHRRTTRRNQKITKARLKTKPNLKKAESGHQHNRIQTQAVRTWITTDGESK